MDLAKITDGFVKQETHKETATTNTGPTPDLSPVTPSKECEKRPREDDEEDMADKRNVLGDKSNVAGNTSSGIHSTPTSSSPPGLSHFAHLMQKSDTMYRQNLNSDQYIYSDEEKENHNHSTPNHNKHPRVPHTPSSVSLPPQQQPQYAFISHSITSYPSNEPQIDNARLARRKRRRTSPTELALLEQEFARNQKPPKHIRVDIARRVDMTEKAVQVWFQNKRQSVRKSMNKSMTDDTSFADSSFAETTFDDADSNNSSFLSTINNTHSNKSISSDTRSPLAQSTSASEATKIKTEVKTEVKIEGKLSSIPSIPPPSDSNIASVAPKSSNGSFSVFEDSPAETPAKKKPSAPRLSMRGGKATVIYAGKPKGALSSSLANGRRLGVSATPSSPATSNPLGLGGSPLATSSPMTQRTASQLNSQASASSPLSALKTKSFGTAEESLAATLKKRLPSMHYDLPVTNKTSSVRHGVSSPVVDAGSREAECISNLLSLRNGGRW